MLERLLDFSLSHRIATFVLAAVLLGCGLFAFKNLTIEALPDPTDTQVEIIGADSAAKHTRDRLRAVLMTALLASLGLLPAAMSHAIGSETQRPIAVVGVGGTISAAMLALIVLPVTFYMAAVLQRRLARRELPAAAVS